MCKNDISLSFQQGEYLNELAKSYHFSAIFSYEEMDDLKFGCLLNKTLNRRNIKVQKPIFYIKSLNDEQYL